MSVKYSFLDQILMSVDNALRTLFSETIAQTPSPSVNQPESVLMPFDRKHSAALMRINHTGEICAQALYYGQAITAKSPAIKNSLLKAGAEETDHLAWCQQRLTELKDHTSYLNPFWYIGSFSLGLVAGAISDQWSLGFVVETERQVERHLQAHLEQLPVDDLKSRKILQQMCQDEAHHATIAMAAGALELPGFIKKIMTAMSKIMTTTAYHI